MDDFANPLFLDVETILQIHAEQIAAYGGDSGIRDSTLLESAAHAPLNVWQYQEGADIYDLAASYCFHLASNHPFIDGNKRTGLAAALKFLSVNGLDPARRGTYPPKFQIPDDELAGAVIARITGSISHDDFAQTLFQAVGAAPVTDALAARPELDPKSIANMSFESENQKRAYVADLLLTTVRGVLMELSQKFCIKPERFEVADQTTHRTLIKNAIAQYQSQFGMTIEEPD